MLFSLNKDQYDTWCNNGDYNQAVSEQLKKTNTSRTLANNMNKSVS